MINKICDIAREASKIMLKRDFDVRNKDNNDSNIVTSADIAVQKFLEEELLTILPGSVFLGEEDENVKLEGEYIWVVDPIDGTANYMRDMKLSVISIALLKDNKQFIGVVYYPYMDEMYYAKAGEGAFMNGKRIYVSDRPFNRSMLCSAMSLYRKDLAKPCFNIIERIYMEADDLRRLGTAALELCYIASGKCELYFELRLSPWDYAAATLIVKEAGGFFDIMFNDSLPLDTPAAIICANTEENFKRMESIIYDEIKEPLY